MFDDLKSSGVEVIKQASNREQPGKVLSTVPHGGAVVNIPFDIDDCWDLVEVPVDRIQGKAWQGRA